MTSDGRNLNDYKDVIISQYRIQISWHIEYTFQMCLPVYRCLTGNIILYIYLKKIIKNIIETGLSLCSRLVSQWLKQKRVNYGLSADSHCDVI